MLFSYLDPMTTIPLTSVLVTVVGFFLLLGRMAMTLPVTAARRLGRGLVRLRVALGVKADGDRPDEGA
ncbi:MAG TPA: hypothetical protein VG406_17440 [Isosphaeraceae bacterium]|jgi:hypothetical protein|nr:hypothetical protein [Isosphaeraceae bacterium]